MCRYLYYVSSTLFECKHKVPPHFMRKKMCLVFGIKLFRFINSVLFLLIIDMDIFYVDFFPPIYPLFNVLASLQTKYSSGTYFRYILWFFFLKNPILLPIFLAASLSTNLKFSAFHHEIWIIKRGELVSLQLLNSSWACGIVIHWTCKNVSINSTDWGTQTI